MRTVTSIQGLRRLVRRWRQGGRAIGFVPTMGYLHEGHLSLVREARRRVGHRGVVVVSIYVNPTQFAPHEDLAKYPRDVPRDCCLCRRVGTDVVFLPSDAEMYPDRAEGQYSTYVVEESLSQRMEGAARPAHFRGVTTVVGKLFNLVQPDVAVFGAKDFQQAAVVSRMVTDLNFPVEVVVAPTVRETDGLAMSSRNQYLSPEERAQASILWRAIGEAQRCVAANDDGVPAAGLKRQLARLIATQPAARLDYVEVFDPRTLLPVKRARAGSHLALAVYVGRTRLIDNARL